MTTYLDKNELEILNTLDAHLRKPSAISAIDEIVPIVERKLTQERETLLAWEPVPLQVYGDGLPQTIRSSWVFILRAHATTGAERHPNSIQRVVAYRGNGDQQIWRDDKWVSHLLVSDLDAELEQRWAVVPINTWHQVVVPEHNWVVVSFHTVPEKELIEERPDPIDPTLTRQRYYLD